VTSVCPLSPAKVPLNGLKKKTKNVELKSSEPNSFGQKYSVKIKGAVGKFHLFDSGSKYKATLKTLRTIALSKCCHREETRREAPQLGNQGGEQKHT